MIVCITGAAGFIGSHLTYKLLDEGHSVIGIDNINDYYDVALKEARLARLQNHASAGNFTFHRADIADRAAVQDIFARNQNITHVVHLAAQAGVRYSLENPYTYIDSNIMGQTVMLEASRALPELQHFVYASSSSVYGGNKKIPFSVKDPVDHPVSIYAASKKSCELIAHSYSHLYDIPTTGLRFFTVYGPWGRPDMAAYLFTRAIVDGKPINVFNHGAMKRDFTYIDDIVAGLGAAIMRPPARDADGAPYRIYNLGNNRSEELSDYIGIIEQELGMQAEKNMMELQPGDVPLTYADITESETDLGYHPTTPITVGLPKFVQWFKDYHKIG